MPVDRSTLENDYYLEITDPKKINESWGWEIRRKSKPLGIKMNGQDYRSERDARLAGEKALHDFLKQLFRNGD